jgi:hypothetical protein
MARNDPALSELAGQVRQARQEVQENRRNERLHQTVSANAMPRCHRPLAALFVDDAHLLEP